MSTFLLFYFRRIDDDRGKAYELGQSSVKCMRGILFCWMRQAEEKVLIFTLKYNLKVVFILKVEKMKS